MRWLWQYHSRTAATIGIVGMLMVGVALASSTPQSHGSSHVLHAVFTSLSLHNPDGITPAGQLPEVPFSAAIPIILLVGLGGFALYRRFRRG